MPMVVDQHACSPSSRELDIWLAAEVEERAVLLVQQWKVHDSEDGHVPMPLVGDNLLGRHVAMQRVAEQVLEKVEVVSQLSMELLACMVH